MLVGVALGLTQLALPKMRRDTSCMLKGPWTFTKDQLHSSVPTIGAKAASLHVIPPMVKNI